MQATLYANLSTGKLSSKLDDSQFVWPKLIAGDDVRIALRFAEKVDGRTVEVERTVNSLRASIGWTDARPTRGAFAIKVGEDTAEVGTNVTADLNFDCEASELQTALNDLSEVGGGGTYGAATVTEVDDSFLIVFADEAAAVPLSAASNSLGPLSFLKVRAYQIDGQWVHELRLTQAPVSSTSEVSVVVPPAPSISALLDGGEADGAEWNEIQKLTIPPTFRGAYQIRRGSFKSSPLSRSDGPAQILAAMNEGELADEDGEFFVTNPYPGVAHIEFAGSMGGEDQALLTIEVFDAPPGDAVFTLNLDRAEVMALLRAEDEVEVPLEIELELEDPQDDEILETHSFRVDVKLRRELNYDALAAVASVDWQRPPLPFDYIPFSESQVSNGQIHYATALGDGVATEFVIDHNLNTPRVDVILHLNNSAGAPLVYGTDYTYERDDDDSLTLTALGDPPAEDAWLITVLGLAQTSFFDSHTHPIAQVELLQQTLDSLGQRLTNLEALAPSGALGLVESDPAQLAAWQLPALFEVYPLRGGVTIPSTTLSAIQTSALPRAGGLLAAVHDASVEALTTPLASPAASLIGRVFENQTAGDIQLPGGQGHRGVALEPGQFAACDGRVWYRVVQYGSAAETSYYPYKFERTLFELFVNEKQLRIKREFLVEFGLELAVLNATSKCQWTVAIELGTAPQDSTPATPGINLQNVIWPSEVDYSGQTFAADAGTDVCTASAHGYETGMQVQLTTSGTLPAGLSLATNYYVIYASANTFKLASSPANAWAGTAVDITDTGSGTHTITRRESAALEQRVIVTAVPTVHKFGIRVSRSYVDEVDTLSLDQLLYGVSEAGVPPLTPNFAVRARLIRFDTENSEPEPRGFIALRGLNADLASGTNGPGIATVA